MRTSDEFRPEQNSRRGEFIAWGATLMVGLAWLVLTINNQDIPNAIPFLGIFLLLSSASISLGNWVDRRTVIRVSTDGIGFKNGLRNVRMNWDEIKQVRVIPTRWGSKIQTFSDTAFFEFRKLGEVKLSGNFTGKIGFKQGDEILQQIILKSGLQIIENQGEGYYYARQ